MTIKQYLQQHYASGTVEEYTRAINSYLSNYPDAPAAKYNDVVQYIGALRNRYNNTATLRKTVSAIKSYYAYLCEEGIRKDNPAKAIKLRDRINKDIQLQDLFTTQELEKLLERKEPYKNIGYKNKVMMGLLIYQALQPQEICNLTIEDINLTAGTIYIKATTTTNARTLSLKPNQILLFYAYIHTTHPALCNKNTTNRLLIGLQGNPLNAWDVSMHVRRCFKKCYPDKKITPRTIRQSVIANLLKQGHDISVVQSFAGHKLPGATQRYKQNSVDTLKTAIQKYHPLQ
jgi:integrase/recombinase XerD